MHPIHSFSYRGKAVQIQSFAPTDAISRYLEEQEHFYEIELLEYLMTQRLRPGTYLDVGANIGNHVVFLGLYSPATQIIAFEPNPQLQPIVEYNISVNKLSHARLCRHAVGAIPGVRGTMVLPPEGQDNVGMHIFTPDASGDVLTVTLDDATAEDRQRSPVSFIKIDAEFMEFDILAGAEKILSEDKPDLVIECTEEPRLKSYLEPYGYTEIANFYRDWSSPTLFYRHRDLITSSL